MPHRVGNARRNARAGDGTTAAKRTGPRSRALPVSSPTTEIGRWNRISLRDTIQKVAVWISAHDI
jgi:hypothetical protein